MRDHRKQPPTKRGPRLVSISTRPDAEGVHKVRVYQGTQLLAEFDSDGVPAPDQIAGIRSLEQL